MMLLIKEKCRKYIEERETRQKRRVEKGIEEKKKRKRYRKKSQDVTEGKCTARERREITFVEDIERKGTESKIRIGREID